MAMRGRARCSSERALAERALAERGLALLVVLWALAVLAAVLVAFSATTGTETRLTRNRLDQARAAALAEGGVQLAALALIDPEQRKTLPIDGTAFTRDIDGVALTLNVQDETGKVDLNLAPPDLLAGLFTAVGLPERQAQLAAAAVARWRNGEGPGGGDDAWRNAGGDGVLRRPFLSVAQMQQVPGMNRPLYQAAAPYVTVLGLAPGIDPSVAPVAVLAAVPGLGRQAAQRLVAGRPAAHPGSLGGLPASAGLAPFAAWLSASPGVGYGVTVTVPMAGGGTFKRQAVLWMSQRRDQPFAIVDWR